MPPPRVVPPPPPPPAVADVPAPGTPRSAFMSVVAALDSLLLPLFKVVHLLIFPLFFPAHEILYNFLTTLPSLPPVILSVLKRHFTWIWFSPSIFFDLRLTHRTLSTSITHPQHYPGKGGKRWVLVAAISRPPATRGGSSAFLHYNNHNNNNNNNHDINDTNERVQGCVRAYLHGSRRYVVFVCASASGQM